MNKFKHGNKLQLSFGIPPTLAKFTVDNDKLVCTSGHHPAEIEIITLDEGIKQDLEFDDELIPMERTNA